MGGNKEANTQAGSPEPGVRVPALRSPVEPAWEARGTCRPESLEWRARDVSAPCLARHLTPSPPTACALAPLQSSEQAPPSAAASASLGERTDPGCGDPAAEAPRADTTTPRRRRKSRPRQDGGGHRAPAFCSAGSSRREDKTRVRREGGRVRALQLQQAVRGARRPFAGAAAAAAPPHWGTEGAARG